MCCFWGSQQHVRKAALLGLSERRGRLVACLDVLLGAAEPVCADVKGRMTDGRCSEEYVGLCGLQEGTQNCDVEPRLSKVLMLVTAKARCGGCDRAFLQGKFIFICSRNAK